MTGESKTNEPSNPARWIGGPDDPDDPDVSNGSCNALFLTHFREIETAPSIDALRSLGVRILDVVRITSRPGADIKNMAPKIARLNDTITLRLIALLESTEDIRLPDGATYIALGSEGRGDQILRTDQDSAIVFVDDLPADKRPEIERFATRIVDALEEIGVPRCPGNIMASNPQWRHSLSEWKRLLNQWIDIPTPEHILNFGMFQGLRALHGDKTVEKQLHDHILAATGRPTLFFPYMAVHALRFPLPLSMFGRLRVEHRGEHRGRIDIKKAGIFAITVGASLLALEAGFVDGNTWRKLELLGKLGILAPGDLETIENSFTFLVQFRLQWQLRELAANGKPTNHADPRAMTEEERRQFRQALKGVATFLRFMNNRYQLNLISR
jgi:CBS domain-containing protein